jgi:hypothetical protein
MNPLRFVRFFRVCPVPFCARPALDLFLGEVTSTIKRLNGNEWQRMSQKDQDIFEADVFLAARFPHTSLFKIQDRLDCD